MLLCVITDISTIPCRPDKGLRSLPWLVCKTQIKPLPAFASQPQKLCPTAGNGREFFPRSAAAETVVHACSSDNCVAVMSRKSLVVERHGRGLQRAQRAEEAATWPALRHPHHTICWGAARITGRLDNNRHIHMIHKEYAATFTGARGQKRLHTLCAPAKCSLRSSYIVAWLLSLHWMHKIKESYTVIVITWDKNTESRHKQQNLWDPEATQYGFEFHTKLTHTRYRLYANGICYACEEHW